MPPCRTPGDNQERSRKKGSIIKLSDNYNFVELFPQLKILLAQQITALQSTAPGTPFIYTEHVKSQNQKSNRRELHTVEQRKYRKAERRTVMKLEDFETELELFDSFTKERFPESSQGYTQEYRLYLQIKPNGNVAGYALGESHCGHGQGCFWSDEEIWPCTLDEYNSLRRRG